MIHTKQQTMGPTIKNSWVNGGGFQERYSHKPQQKGYKQSHYGIRFLKPHPSFELVSSKGHELSLVMSMRWFSGIVSVKRQGHGNQWTQDLSAHSYWESEGFWRLRHDRYTILSILHSIFQAQILFRCPNTHFTMNHYIPSSELRQRWETNVIQFKRKISTFCPYVYSCYVKLWYRDWARSLILLIFWLKQAPQMQSIMRN